MKWYPIYVLDLPTLLTGIGAPAAAREKAERDKVAELVVREGAVRRCGCTWDRAVQAAEEALTVATAEAFRELAYGDDVTVH